MAVNRRLKERNRRSAPYVLPKLAKKANKYHEEAENHWKGMAENARKSGKALNKARYYGLWPRGKWKEWLIRNFDGSLETAKVYMRIAKKWEDPRLEEARKLGVTLDSINKILEVLSGKRNTDGTLNVKQSEVDYLRQGLREEFAKKLRTELTRDDIVIIGQNYVFDELWDKYFYPRIRKTVCGAYGYDPYQYENKRSKFYKRYVEEEEKTDAIRRRTVKALNKKK